MADFIKFEGKTVDDAIANACAQLSCTADDLEINVLEEGTSGLFGLFGGKTASISVRKKEIVSEEVKEEIVSEAEPVSEVKAVSGNPEELAKEFLSSVFEKMGLSVDISAFISEEEEALMINLEGENIGSLIGKRGQTLDSLQYLTSLVVNKNRPDYLRVKLDSANYRERRKETLENLAKNIASRVKRTRRAVKLEPMNPYERRIIHSALQNDEYVYTKSEGEEPYRYVVVLMKKDAPEIKRYNNNRYGYRNRYGNNRYGHRSNNNQ